MITVSKNTSAWTLVIPPELIKELHIGTVNFGGNILITEDDLLCCVLFVAEVQRNIRVHFESFEDVVMFKMAFADRYRLL